MNATKRTAACLTCSFAVLAVVSLHAATLSYTLDNLFLAGGQQITGAFDWTYSVGDFAGGSGEFTSLSIPYTAYSFAAGNLNTTIEANMIEITGNGNYHDMGLDITLFLSPPLSPTESAPLELGSSFFECCGNGFHDQPFQSGRVVPSAFLVGDFDIDNDADAFDFLVWQGSDIAAPYSLNDYLSWEAYFGMANPWVALSDVPEPVSALLFLMATAAVASLRLRLF